MPRYQVFHLTRSDLGDISLPKKSFFLVKSITPMYLLFNPAAIGWINRKSAKDTSTALRVAKLSVSVHQRDVHFVVW